MKLSFQKNYKDLKSENYIFFFFENKKAIKEKILILSKSFHLEFNSTAVSDFSGKAKEVILVYHGKKRILLAGLGSEDKFNLEILRKSTSSAIKKASSLKFKSIAVEIISFTKLNSYDIALAQSESALLSLYKFDKYKTDNKKHRTGNLDFFSFETDKKYIPGILKGISHGEIISESVSFARDLGNEPSNIAYPDSIAKLISSRAGKYKIKITVLKKNDITKLKMNAVLAVSKGSNHEPRFLVMKYNGASAKKKPIALVGKGVTFDSGGISLKPGAGMADMKMDMCGAAAVLGAFEAAARLKLKVNLVGLIPLVENMPGGNALKPGDVIKAHNGKFIEVDNTDAEGRLILADALSYAGIFKPKFVIDLATLTGAALIVLGHEASPVMGNDIKLMEKLKSAGDYTFERIWELPLWDEFDKMTEAYTGDILNVGPPRQAGTIMGAAFLKKFIGNYSWAHLDIAGTAIMPKDSDYISKNASGVGVRLLTRFLIGESG